MGYTHAGTETSYTIHSVGPEQHEVHVGCFGWRDGEDVEDRWNEFAQEMWRAGLQPYGDEPVFTFTEGDVIYDHYYLVSIYDEECDAPA